MSWSRRTAAALAALCTLFVSARAHAFVHIVMPGETLASIAIDMYGNAALEGLLVAANNLDAQGGTIIRPGMRLEIPASSHYRATGKDSWADIALRFLGDAKRGDPLATFNRKNAWIPPASGTEITLPYVLSHVASENDKLANLAKRYLKDSDRFWELDTYNNFGGRSLHKGDLVLVPLFDLELTERGRKEARMAEAREAAEGRPGPAIAQTDADKSLPELEGHVVAGRYLDAIVLGSRMAEWAGLSDPQVAAIHRALLEAFVAFGANEHAAKACFTWRAHSHGATLDPVRVSPKVRAACSAPPP